MQQPSNISLAFQEEMKKSRELEMYHHSYAAEVRMFDAVRQGSIEMFKKALTGLASYDSSRVQLADDPLRHQKNYLIAVTTLVTRAMIDGGVPSEQAFIMSDVAIREIERIESPKVFEPTINDIFVQAIEVVNRNKRLTCSPEIYLALEYITLNLYQKLTVESIAKSLHISTTYLSTKFKKEMGVTLSDYIQKQKINEAQYLINHTKYTFTEIYTLLHFSDQSHFIRVFKKHTGMLPKDFKKTN